MVLCSVQIVHYFPVAILVPTDRRYTNQTGVFILGFVKFLRNISMNILRLSLFRITSQFLDFIHWMVFDLCFYCVTLKTMNCYDFYF